jgi:predicted DNA-binding transcriptional regulator YafY
MYHPTTRLLTVLELLQSHPRLTGAELATRLEVDVRTVRRYIMMLQDLGIPVEGAIGRYGGYALRPGYKLPPLMFTEDEVVALTVGLMMARQVGLGTNSTAVAGALAKLERVLPAPLRERTRAVQATVGLELGPAEVAVDSAVLSTLSLAVQERRQVTFRYRARDETETSRLLDPYGVASHDARWYVAGYCHLRGDVRVFRLDRMAAVRLGDGSFDSPPGFDALEYVLRRFATIPDYWNVEVIFKTTLADTQRKVPRPYGLLEPHPDGVLLRTSVSDLDDAARFLVSLGFPLVVRQPPQLKEAFARLADEAKVIAGSGQ